ncbi:MAG: ABC transporter permease [Thermoanaerobaculia bacterium]|nr:ABC transporter permease [Thermoanaerobaculia bacterium]
MAPATLPAGFARAFAQGLRSLRGNPLRSGLGVLAIAVAVATLATVHTAVEGLTLFARQSTARAFGSDTFVVAQVGAAGQVSRRELARKLERNPPLRRADARFLDAFAGGRVLYAPIAQRGAEVSAGARTFENAAVAGTGHRLSEIRELAVAEGRFFSADEERAGRLVAVLGRDVADALFPGRDPLGRTVRLAGRGFEVIGVQARLGTSGGVSLDRNVWVPLPAWERAYGAAPSLQLSGRPPAGLAVAEAEDRARATMRARRRLPPGAEDNFDILAPEAARNFALAVAGRVGGVAPVLSAMALLAAIVVVANTTLVSVAQRTFEIGVRRAVGATRGEIVREVLAESTLVALVGGAIGTAVVALATRVLAGPLGLELALAPRTVALAVGHAAGAGLLAGWYPARRASRVDIIRALRVE